MTMHTEGPWSAAETRHNYDTIIRGPNGEPIALALVDGYTKRVSGFECVSRPKTVA